MRIIAGIGSRATPSNILDEMILIGDWCRVHDVWVRSGHAEGADWAFEHGAQQQCIAYLPWHGFNAQLRSKAHLVTSYADSPMLNNLVTKYHPAPDKLSRGAYQLMLRNGCQLYGLDGEYPTNAIVCWTSDGEASGGTGQAIRIAEANKIPVLNMYKPQFNTRELVKRRLMEIFGI